MEEIYKFPEKIEKKTETSIQTEKQVAAGTEQALLEEINKKLDLLIALKN